MDREDREDQVDPVDQEDREDPDDQADQEDQEGQEDPVVVWILADVGRCEAVYSASPISGYLTGMNFGSILPLLIISL